MESVNALVELAGVDAPIGARNDVFTQYLLGHWALLAPLAEQQAAQGDDTAPLRALVLACAFTTGDIETLDEARNRLAR